MMTKAHLDRLRAQRRRPEATPALTPDGVDVLHVHQAVAAQHERQIAAGDASLKDALDQMRLAYSVSSMGGLASAQFNHSKQEIKP